MLQFLHERVKGWFAYGFGIIIALTFGLLGIERYLFTTDIERNVVTINGEDISKASFNRDFERARMQHQEATGRGISDQNELKKLKKDVLEALIQKRLLVQTAVALGLAVTDDSVNTYITTQIPVLREDGKFSTDRFSQLLRSLGMTAHRFKEEVREQLLIQQLATSLEYSQFVLPREVIFAYALGLETRDIRYIELKPEQFNQNINISNADIKKYYDRNKESFTTPEKVSVEYLTLSYDDVKKNVKVSDQEVKDYYQQNQANFRTPARWQVAHLLISDRKEKAKEKAEEIHQQITKGGDFAALVKKHSDDVVTKNDAGKLPWVTLGTLDSSIDTELLNLKVGDVSKPFKSKYGYEIIKLLDKKESVTKPFASVKGTIHDTLLRERVQKQFDNLSDELADITFTNPTTLKPAAEKLKMKLNTTGLFSRKNNNKDITNNPKVIQAAFSGDVLLQGNNSDIIALNATTALILRVKDHQAKRLKPLTEVKSSITEILKKKQMLTRAKAYAEKIRVANAQSKAELIKAKSLSWTKQKDLDRRGAMLDSKMVNAIFSIPVAGNMTQASKVVVIGDKVTLIQVDKAHPGKIDKLKKGEVKGIARQIARGLGMMEYELFINSVKEHSKIVRHEL